MNEKTEKIYKNKLKKDIDSILYEYNDPLAYTNIANILHSLYFMQKKSGACNTQEDNLITELWKVLEGNANNGISKESLKSFLLAIMGCNSILKDNKLKSAIPKFSLFKANRLKNGGALTRNKSNILCGSSSEFYSIESSFQPTISKVSIDLAKVAREKIISKINARGDNNNNSKLGHSMSLPEFFGYQQSFRKE